LFLGQVLIRTKYVTQVMLVREHRRDSGCES
jgi:hypothetical protein